MENQLEEKYKGLNLWRKVEMTDPSHTKDASFGRKITAIDAYQQIKNFTEQFGACGFGWGYNSKLVNGGNSDVCIVELELWFEGGRSITELGSCEWFQGKPKPDGSRKLDPDAPKKATTDAMTKAFSRLGFNADVFLGMFEDNRYIQHAAQEKNNEKQAKNREAMDSKNQELIRTKLLNINTPAELVDIMQKMELHFAPIYAVEVGKFFKIEAFKNLIIKKCESLKIDPKEIIGE